MKKIELYEYQEDALNRMKNGCILCGGVGSGKSRTSLAYYYTLFGGQVNAPYVEMKDPIDLYIITTARKRDTGEWEEELEPFGLSPTNLLYSVKVTIDSWNNIKKYKDITNSFFIFDEQRVIGYGTWTQSFLKIVKSNKWILLSATPGDTWSDYIPVFIANGFYRHKTEFMREHAVWNKYTRYPKIDRYINQGLLLHYRDSILVNMDFIRKTVSHHEDCFCSYNVELYRYVMKHRTNPFTEETPIENAGELCFVLRKIVNSDESRQQNLLNLLGYHPKAIIFYNYDFERDILKNLAYSEGTCVAEWNGHLHQTIPRTDKWVYLVQYTSGSEGWNCTETNTIIFYSQNYSYRITLQASGRIDRLNTPFVDLYYYHMKSAAPIDLAIARALHSKKNFEERGFVSHIINKKKEEIKNYGLNQRSIFS